MGMELLLGIVVRVLVSRDAKSQLPVKRLLLHARPLDILQYPRLDPFHLLFGGMWRGGGDEVDMVSISVFPAQIIARAQRQHLAAHDPRAVGQRVGFFH